MRSAASISSHASAQAWQASAQTRQCLCTSACRLHSVAQERQKAMQEGPLPFLFNFKAAEAKKKSESGGPVVYAPIRRSFGTRLIGSLGQQLKGEVQLTYSPAGFAYALDVPMSSLVPA